MARELIDPKRAADLYRRLGCWEKAAQEMPRKDGTLYTPHGLFMAVRRMDLAPPKPVGAQ